MPCERKHIEAIMTALARNGRLVVAIDAASDAFNEALSACDESPWRSMESAPKGEVDVLLWCPDLSPCPTIGYCDRRGDWAESVSCESCEPTHWMPLPAAPEVG